METIIYLGHQWIRNILNNIEKKLIIRAIIENSFKVPVSIEKQRFCAEYFIVFQI